MRSGFSTSRVPGVASTIFSTLRRELVQTIEIRPDDAHRDRRRDRRAVAELVHVDARVRILLELARAAGRARAAYRRVSYFASCTNTSRVVCRRRCAGCGCSRSAGCRARGWRTTTSPPACSRSLPSTKRSARSVSARLLPSGVSTCDQELRRIGLREQAEADDGTPTPSITTSEPPSDAAHRELRPRQAPVQQRLVEAMDRAHDAHCSKRLPCGSSRSLSTRLARNGMMNSATSSEAPTVTTTAIGSTRMNLPGRAADHHQRQEGEHERGRAAEDRDEDLARGERSPPACANALRAGSARCSRPRRWSRRPAGPARRRSRRSRSG